MDRALFFAHVRTSLFGGYLSVSQVDGMEVMLDYWEGHYADQPRAFLAYILATVFHETGRLMVPVREGFAKSDAEAIAYVRRQGYAYSKVGVYGFVPYGRGRVQTTWDANYAKVAKRFGIDCTHNPDLLLDPVVDAAVAVTGHVEGIWTGRKLSMYFGANKSNPTAARAIVNGKDKAAEIAGYFVKFDDCLAAAIAHALSPAGPLAIPLPTITPSPAGPVAPKPRPPMPTHTTAGTGAAGAVVVAAGAAAAQQPSLLHWIIPAALVVLLILVVVFRKRLAVIFGKAAPVAQVPAPLPAPVPPPTLVKP